MATDPSPPTLQGGKGEPPLWRQVLDDLEQRIAGGDITDRFPTDRELTDWYGVSRHTVREAVRRLRTRGLVDRHRGRGSVLNSERLTQPLGGLYSLFRAVEEQGLEQRSEVLGLAVVRDADAAGRLEMSEDVDLVRLERLRFAGEDPLAVDVVFLPLDIGQPLFGVDLSRTALYDQLAQRVDTRITSVDESLEPIVPGTHERELLHLAPGEALFRVRRLGRSGDRPVECRVTLIRGQRFVYTSAWRADGHPQGATTFAAAGGDAGTAGA